MVSSASGQDESNPALWLATQAGKMEPSCLLGTTCLVLQEKFPQKPYNKSFIDQACLVKIAWYWARSFFACLWTSTPSWSINTQKKELSQYPAILTSHLVNNPYISRPLTFSNHTYIYLHLVSYCGRHGGLMISALKSGSRSQGSSPGQGHFVVFLGSWHFTLTVPLFTQVYQWLPANLMLGDNPAMD